MKIKFVSASVMVALLAACNANIAIQASGTGKVDKVAKPKASAPAPSASPSPSPSPSASAAPALVAASTAPPAVINPFGIPTAISPGMPAAVIATGGGNLIGQAGGNLIGQAGGNLIGQAGGNVISTGGGNYAVLQTPPAFDLKTTLSDTLESYILGAAVTKSILASKEFKGLTPGVPKSGRPDIALLNGMEVTGLLELKADYGLLTVWLGPAMTDEKKMITIRFTSPTKGKAVYHGLMFPDNPILVAEYDLDAGYGMADGVNKAGIGELLMTHYEFRERKGDPKGITYTVQSSQSNFNPQEPEKSGFFVTVGHYMKDGSGAVVLGIQDQVTNNELALIPTDGLFRSDMPDKPHDFFVDPEGKNVPAASVTDALKAVAPTLADVYKPFPEMPTATYDVKKDPRYDFLK